jgi:hypothetical protein
MPDASAATVDWTCERCHVMVSFMPGTKNPKLPSTWADVDGKLHCLGCQREFAGEAGLEGLAEDAPASDRQKLRSHARIEFEVKRDPERPDNQIAKACHTSVIAVRKASMSRRSQGTNIGAVPTAAETSRTSVSPASASMSRKATRAPWAAKWATWAAPIPVAPPVTKTGLSRRLG